MSCRSSATVTLPAEGCIVGQALLDRDLLGADRRRDSWDSSVRPIAPARDPSD
jgi:hypothetical protein